MLDRSHLLILQQIQQQGSLTKAAQQLHLTQSALSHKIKKLEDYYGASLWAVEGRKIKFTQAGELLLQAAAKLLPQFDRLDAALKQFALGNQGRLFVGMECSPCYQWLLKIVQPYLAAWPRVEVDVKQQFQFGGMEALLNQAIDVLVTPDPQEHSDVEFMPVFPYEQVLVVANKHRLAKQNLVSPQDLTQEVIYTYPVATDRLDIFLQFLLPANCQPKEHRTMGSTEMLLQMVVAGRGVTSLPLWLVEEQAQQLPIQKLRLGKQGVHKHIHLGIRKADLELGYVQAFIELAKANPSLKT